MLKRIIILIGAVAAILLGLVFIVPFVLPADTIKNQIETLVAENTGWNIRFGGDVKVSLIPSVRLVAHKIEVSPPNHKPILDASQARFSVGLSALFSGAVNIEEIYFNEPNLTIELSESGSPVWLVQNNTPKAATNAATPSGSEGDEKGTVGGIVQALVDSLQVQRLAIDRATVTYGAIGEEPNTFKNFNFSASLPDSQGALKMRGSALFNDEKVSLKGELPNFKDLINTNKGAVSVEAGYRNAKLSTDGPLDLGADRIFDGAVNLEVTNIARLAGSDALARNTLKARGKLSAGKTQVQLDLSEGTLGETAFTSTILAQTGGVRPVVSGSIDFGDLNLDEIQKASPSTSSGETSGETSGKKAESNAQDLSAVSAVDANVSFSASSITSGEHTIKDIKGRVVINNGVADLTIDELHAVGGAASAKLRADTKVSPLQTFGSVRANNVSIPTILAIAGQDALVKQLQGFIAADLFFGFEGLDELNIISSMNAQGKVTISDASMSGLGLASAFGDPAADRIDDVSLTAYISDFTKPITVKGRASWRGQAMALDATSDPVALIAGHKAKTNATLTSSLGRATFSGDIAKSIPSKGTISLEGKSLRELAKWLGTDLPAGDGYGRFDIKTGFNTSPKRVRLNEFTLELDNVKGSGEALVIFDDKPNIIAEVSFDLLDVNPYIAPPAQGSDGGTGEAKSTGGAGWSNEPIDFSFIQSANVNLKATVGTLKAEGMSVGPVTLKTIMRDGKLTADLSEMEFYGGQATAEVVVDAAHQLPALSAKLTSQNVQAYPFLRDAAKFERIEGGLDYTLDVTTTGNSQAAMVAALNGKTKFNFSDGAIRGINIAKAMRSLTSGSLVGLNNSETEKTDFNTFTASFDIANGIATNTDLNLIGPLVRVTGEGAVQMPPQTLKYRVNPKVVASLEGQGSEEDLSGFGVPIIVEGPWDKPKIYPDIKGFLQDPQAGLAKLKSLGGGFDKIKSGKSGDLIGALGNDGENSTVAKATDKLKEKTDVDVGAILQDGKISKEEGAAALVGALGGLLGGGADTQPEAAETEPADAVTPPVEGLPLPRAKPAVPTRPASPVAEIINQVTKPQNATPNPASERPIGQPVDAEEVLRGLGQLFE